MENEDMKELWINKNCIQLEKERDSFKVNIFTVLSNIVGIPIDISHTILSNYYHILEIYYGNGNYIKLGSGTFQKFNPRWVKQDE
jgi:hypothetical protein